MHNLTKIKLFRIVLWLTYPIALLLLYPLAFIQKKRSCRHFFFFDRYAIGGAQKVHLDILESIKHLPKTVFFTRKSQNEKLKTAFYEFENTECKDIHVWCDFLVFRIFSVHYFSFLMNCRPDSVVLSSNSTFFYDMLPFLSNKLIKIELLHNFSYGKKGMEFFGLANYQYLDYRLVIDKTTHENIVRQYAEYKVTQSYLSRIKVIEYGVDIPPETVKPGVPPLRILYAGRGTNQKRIWLLNRIAEHFIKGNASVDFTFAGSMKNELSAEVRKHYRVLDEIGDKEEMHKLFAESHVVILTSSFEGFPVMIKEGMAFGCVPIVTGLSGIKTHLKQNANALLMEFPENEDSVVDHAIQYIKLLHDDPEKLNKLAANCYDYARTHFSKQNFLADYRQLLSAPR